MEDDQSSILIAEGAIKSVKLSLSTEEEICTYSINDCPVTHPSQLSNPFLGLPLEAGKCESCGASENDKCEGHFGYIELPVPVFHPCHVSELRQLLSLVCLKCLRVKKGKVKKSNGNEKASGTSCYYCRDLPALTLKEIKTTDGAIRLELRASAQKHMREDSWNFLNKYGFPYGGYSRIRPLLPAEVLNILKKIPDDTRKKLASRGYIVQSGYVMKYLPVPPNCLYIPEFTDGQSIMSYDISIALLKKVLQKIEQIKRSRSGCPNFESHEAESCDLQLAIGQYIQLRGTTRGPQDNTKRFAVGTDTAVLSTKQWLEKMKTLFISKGSGFSSRSVLTGDPYIPVDVVGLPSEVAKRITFEEQVTDINISRLQEVVDKGLCLTYRDGQATYAITVGSQGHTTLKVGQTISRRIVDGDVVFLNRPPSTHKHSLQAFYAYVHDDHTVKINPLMCSPFAADFDGDCVHIYYPQSLAAKAEALELFSVRNQLTSSHTGKVNLELGNDSLLALKHISSRTMLRKESANQMAMFVSCSLPYPAVVKSIPSYTITQIVQGALPAKLTCEGDKLLIRDSSIIKLSLDKESVQDSFSNLLSCILYQKGPEEALRFLNVLQPLLMEFLLLDGFSISLQDFNVPNTLLEEAHIDIRKQSIILEQSRCSKTPFVEMRVENNLKNVKQQISDFIANYSNLGLLIDPRKDSSISKVVQQLGFVGLQLYREGKLYSRRLVEDCFSNFVNKHPSLGNECPPEAYGLVSSSYFHGLNPYEELVHAISTREAIVRSSRGLTEPGTLFKNLMAILRDIVICYDGTVRNICSNSIIQLKYGETDEKIDLPSNLPPGEPVGVLAATAISNPAYRVVLDSSQSNNASWELMKEILQTKVGYKNDIKDRKIILFLNDCPCPKKFCKERAAIAVQGCLKKFTLADCATDICIEHQKQISLDGTPETIPTLVGHIHLDKVQLQRINISAQDILQKCQEVSDRYAKKKGQLCHLFKKITFSSCDCSFTQKPIDGKLPKIPCLQFCFSDNNTILFESVDIAVNLIADSVCTVLLDTIVKGDPRIQEAKVIWVESDTSCWVENKQKASKGEPALEIIVKKDEAIHSGDAWRTAIDACIPVLNLIDTQRSIPYGIQQVRELLGISCAFDQVVQRLSKTVKMVAKNVLKDHLILVANSMTCTGNLNGFNTAGYKATFRSLKVQVPFTESTLFTPMKCFERSAEKCDSDSLGCIVSSCSWGKHAAVGTGSSFQILWNDNQLKNNKEYGDGLYDFLALVRTDQEKAGYTFLDDVDYFVEENAADFTCLSPEPDENLGKPTFDDNFEEQDNSGWGGWSKGAAADGPLQTDKDNSAWDVPNTVEVSSDNWGGWGPEKLNDKNILSGEPAGLDTWGNKPASLSENSWDKREGAGGKGAAADGPLQTDKYNSAWDVPSTVEVSTDNWGGWGPEKQNEESILSGEPAGLDTWGNKPASPSKNSWDRREGVGGDDAWEKQAGSCKEQGMNVNQDSWGTWTASPSMNLWDKSKSDASHGNWVKQHSPCNEQNLNVHQDSGDNGWGEKKSDGDRQWEKQPSNYKRKKTNEDRGSWDSVMLPPSRNEWASGKGDGMSNAKSDAWSSWGNNRMSNAKSDAWSSWGNNRGSAADIKKGKMDSDECSRLPNESEPWNAGQSNGGSWEKSNAPQDSWGNSAACSDDMQEGSSDRMTVKDINTQQDSWDNWAVQNSDVQTGCWDTLAAKARPSAAQDSWGNPAPLDDSQNAALGTTNSEAKQSDSWDAWNAAPAEDSSSAAKWNKANDSGSNRGWKSDGWGAKTGSWRSERNNPGRPPRRTDERGPPMPRQRFELTAEEKKILLQIEPIVLHVRRIFREARDGVRIAPEDEKFIKEEVLEHHPEKQRKVSGEIDHIMVDKHDIFQDTRCFFVVSTDGSRSDFSYLKCMENLVRKNFTEDVDSFCMKYLRPRRRKEPEQNTAAEAPESTAAEAPESTAAEDKQGTATPPESQLEDPIAPAAVTPPDPPSSPGVTPQENLDLDPES